MSDPARELSELIGELVEMSRDIAQVSREDMEFRISRGKREYVELLDKIQKVATKLYSLRRKERRAFQAEKCEKYWKETGRRVFKVPHGREESSDNPTPT